MGTLNGPVMRTLVVLPCPPGSKANGKTVFLLWLKSIWTGRWDPRHVWAWRTFTSTAGPKIAQREGHRLIWAIPL